MVLVISFGWQPWRALKFKRKVFYLFCFAHLFCLLSKGRIADPITIVERLAVSGGVIGLLGYSQVARCRIFLNEVVREWDEAADASLSD